MHYSDKVGVCRGGSGSTSCDFTISPGEFVTKVEGTFVDSAISKIVFWSNKGMEPEIKRGAMLIFARQTVGTLWQCVAKLDVRMGIWA